MSLLPLQVWFLVCSQWLQRWKDFANGKGALPGPISNCNLVGADGSPLPDKKVQKDYRAVNQKVWEFLRKQYGGGPEILRRQTMQLYAEMRKPQPNVNPQANKPPASCAPAPRANPPPARTSFSPMETGKRPANPAYPPEPSKSQQQEKPQGPQQRPAQKRKLTCDKCDGNHATTDCPHFKKPRDQHPDAWQLVGKSHLVAASQADQKFVSRGRVVPQPGDGSCLFHALAFGLGGTSARALREEAAQLIERQPHSQIIGTALQDWVKMDSGRSVSGYVGQLRRGAWGGGIELAVLAKSRRVMVEVYEARRGGFARIAKFGEGRKAVQVLYQGRLHYDALLLN